MASLNCLDDPSQPRLGGTNSAATFSIVFDADSDSDSLQIQNAKITEDTGSFVNADSTKIAAADVDTIIISAGATHIFGVIGNTDGLRTVSGSFTIMHIVNDGSDVTSTITFKLPGQTNEPGKIKTHVPEPKLWQVKTDYTPQTPVGDVTITVTPLE